MGLKVFVLVPLILFAFTQVGAQALYSIHTVWDDSFSEWEVYTDIEEDEEGSFTLRWPLSNDWSEWSFRLGSFSGVFEQQWKDNPNVWELRADNEVINIRTRWTNDFTEWRLTSGTVKLTLRSRYTNQLSEWYVVDKKYGSFEMVSENERDPRDWEIYDDLNDEISMPFRLALSFIVITNSTPRI